MNDLDFLLDSKLDDLADLPEFKPFPAGAHRVTIKWDYTKKIGDGAAAQTGVQLDLTAVETVELANTGDTPAKAGDNSNMLFMFRKKDGTPNEMAQGKLKELLKPLGEQFGMSSPREIMDASQGCEVLAVTKIRTDSRNPQELKHYLDIVSIQVI